MNKPKAARPPIVHPLRIANAQNLVRHVFVRDLLLSASIGVHGHEHHAPQRIRINLDLAVREEHFEDDLSHVVCYEKLVAGVRALCGQGHVKLVETLAERIAELCLADARVGTVRVRVEKLDVFEDAASVGVEIERFNA
jgi:dihydroneopterin aldolase